MQPEEIQENADEEQGSDLENLGLKVEPTYDTEKVVEEVTDYVQAVIDIWMLREQLAFYQHANRYK